MIPLQQVVGTDSRGGDFDRQFRPRRPEVRDRWSRVERAFPEGDFPPIVVYQLGDAYHLMLDAGRALAPVEIAGDWYDRVYLPTEEAIRREGLGDACPDATEAELFLTVYRRRRDLFPDCGCRPARSGRP